MDPIVEKYKSVYTGNQIDSAVGKALKLPELVVADAGRVLQVNSSGEVTTEDRNTRFFLYTLYENDWNNKEQTLTITEKTVNDNVRVTFPQSWTGATSQDVLDNINAIADANIYRIIENGTSLTFVCENVPETDLLISVELFK